MKQLTELNRPYKFMSMSKFLLNY